MRILAISLGLAWIIGLASPDSRAATLLGDAQKIGAGEVRSYAELDAGGTPTAIGILFGPGAFVGLPHQRNATSRCFDLNENGRIDETGECEGDYELRLALPAGLAERDDIPYRWIGLNWNPEGHPPAAWAPPHFDMHFYAVSQAEIDGIRVGGCEIFIHCEDLKRATKTVPPRYVAADHVDVKAAVSGMGNHLIDVRTPELGNPPQEFTHTWIYGAYDGQITFYEPMITLAFLLGRPDVCAPIRQPEARERSGLYPTEYCMRYDAGSKATTVSLEGLVQRDGDR
jgi:hypothetical protein